MSYFFVGLCESGFDLIGFDMGGCFPCFGSSDEEESGLKEVVQKESFKEVPVVQSHHSNRVSSG